ncbi:flavodoxin [Marinobacter xestospongiae]|uniref:Flavodoxin n=1 Tax=Marinobacter xestospongiae TaxID=994319 RepID=A0ABU3VWF4_9GAMM|nr:flavodoxin [Marinobacter xestospongiae]MDV2078610.1 flavodoxin [Marinobacter xestospongiae]
MAAIRILVGSVYGGALMTARAIKKTLEPEGHQVTVLETPTLDDIAGSDDPILVCTSTTGQGELPPNLLPFYLALREQLPQMPGRPFGVMVLGDSSYGDTFCGAGELMEEALYETCARKVGDTLRIDALETLEPEEPALPWVREWLQSL